MAILSKGLSGISVICSGYICVLAFSLLHSAVSDVFTDAFVHAFPIIVSFDEVINSVYSLVM